MLGQRLRRVFAEMVAATMWIYYSMFLSHAVL